MGQILDRQVAADAIRLKKFNRLVAGDVTGAPIEPEVLPRSRSSIALSAAAGRRVSAPLWRVWTGCVSMTSSSWRGTGPSPGRNRRSSRLAARRAIPSIVLLNSRRASTPAGARSITGAGGESTARGRQPSPRARSGSGCRASSVAWPGLRTLLHQFLVDDQRPSFSWKNGPPLRRAGECSRAALRRLAHRRDC
jgi:hypothetical protein